MFNLKSLVAAATLLVGSVSAFNLPPHVPRGVGETPTRGVPGRIVTSCTVPRTAALTFDDGPFIYMRNISDALVAAGGKGTFFFNGNNWGCIYDEENVERVKYAYEQGHQIASHTWSHKNLSTLSWDDLHHELWLAEEAIWKISGAYPAVMRPPYGELNDLAIEAARVREQTIALWDFDTRDWALNATEVNQKYTDLVEITKPWHVLTLNHEVHQRSAEEILPHAISVLKAAGYKLVTLSECIGQEPYRFTSPPAERDDTWTCEGKPMPGV